MRTILIALIILISSNLMAQDWKWGEEPTKAKGAWSNTEYYIHTEQYKEANESMQYMLKNTPDLNKSLYIKSAKLYKILAKMEKDPTLKSQYANALMYSYDKRLELYGDSSEVYNRKGLYFYKYKHREYNDKERVQEMYQFYRDLYDMNGEDTYETNYYYLFMAASKAAHLKLIDNDEYYSIYERAMLNVTHEKRIDRIEKTFEKFGKIDCDFVTDNYVPKFEKDSSLELSNKMITALIKGKCGNDELLERLFIYNVSQEDNVKNNWSIAGFYSSRNKAKALPYYKRAVELCEDEKGRAEINYSIASIYFELNNYQKARVYAYKSMKVLTRDSHAIIAAMYYNSCPKYPDGFDKRLVYIAAYQEYKLAGDTEMTNYCKEQFPSMEEVFVRSKELGKMEHLGGWINIDVKLMKRD